MPRMSKVRTLIVQFELETDAARGDVKDRLKECFPDAKQIQFNTADSSK